MQTSLHSRERYCERVLGIPPEEIKAYLEENSAQVEKAVLNMLDEAELIMVKDGKEYRLMDLFLLVAAGQTVVTVVKSDYGFDEDMNRQIVQHLLEKVRALRQELHEKTESALQCQAAIKAEAEALDQEIKSLESKIKEKQALRRQLVARSDGIEAELDALNKLIDQESTKLIYSTAYKLEELRNGKKRA
ncbi:hypothetical protein [Pelotomaculum propionicicum]|uniref:Chromosome partition protein Smc n=1 Tax=Pelotomaculum propionicicum TaxID=258475 RepID=A0A4Y7RNT9_9FIRM|nr:hypothetical protein [Pelotomaculum propionicicum]TEB10658.1 hypothetical protein Pmgp_02238 [Pelotomaculum propionicicum]